MNLIHGLLVPHYNLLITFYDKKKMDIIHYHLFLVDLIVFLKFYQRLADVQQQIYQPIQ